MQASTVLSERFEVLITALSVDCPEGYEFLPALLQSFQDRLLSTLSAHRDSEAFEEQPDVKEVTKYLRWRLCRWELCSLLPSGWSVELDRAFDEYYREALRLLNPNAEASRDRIITNWRRQVSDVTNECVRQLQGLPSNVVGRTLSRALDLVLWLSCDPRPEIWQSAAFGEDVERAWNSARSTVYLEQSDISIATACEHFEESAKFYQEFLGAGKARELTDVGESLVSHLSNFIHPAFSQLSQHMDVVREQLERWVPGKPNRGQVSTNSAFFRFSELCGHPLRNGASTSVNAIAQARKRAEPMRRTHTGLSQRRAADGILTVVKSYDP